MVTGASSVLNANHVLSLPEAPFSSCLVLSSEYTVRQILFLCCRSEKWRLVWLIRELRIPWVVNCPGLTGWVLPLFPNFSPLTLFPLLIWNRILLPTKWRTYADPSIWLGPRRTLEYNMVPGIGANHFCNQKKKHRRSKFLKSVLEHNMVPFLNKWVASIHDSA